MTEANLFTVVIPNYMRIDLLIRAVKSVLIQDNCDIYLDQIIVVDDNSSNIIDIEKALNELANSKILLIKNTYKSNAAATRNQGARLAHSNWVCFLDSDDIFLKGKLNYLSHAVKSNADVYYNRAKVFFDEKLEAIVPSRPLEKNEHISDFLFSSRELMQTSTITVRSCFFNDHGFNEKYIRHQDYDLCLKFADLDLKIEYIDFIGTAIFWNSKDRPNQKGESFKYSKKWLEENLLRMTKQARLNFYYNFVILKAARSSNKMTSVSLFLKADKSIFTVKKYVTYIAILIIPNFLQNLFYVFFKRIKCYVTQFKKKEFL